MYTNLMLRTAVRPKPYSIIFQPAVLGSKLDLLIKQTLGVSHVTPAKQQKLAKVQE